MPASTPISIFQERYNINMEEDEFDQTKYFIAPNGEKIYANKGGHHKGLAYGIINRSELADIYYAYENTVKAIDFLTYCGYVMVDEADEKYKLPDNIFDDGETVKYASVGYCSAAIDESYIEWIKDTYSGGENVVSDCYEEAEPKRKKKIDEIIERIKRMRKAIEEAEKRQDDEEER